MEKINAPECGAASQKRSITLRELELTMIIQEWADVKLTYLEGIDADQTDRERVIARRDRALKMIRKSEEVRTALQWYASYHSPKDRLSDNGEIAFNALNLPPQTQDVPRRDAPCI